MNLSFTLYTPAAIKRRRKKPSYEKEGSVEEKKKVFTVDQLPPTEAVDSSG